MESPRLFVDDPEADDPVVTTEAGAERAARPASAAAADGGAPEYDTRDRALLAVSGVEPAARGASAPDGIVDGLDAPETGGGGDEVPEDPESPAGFGP
jgi:hypothetical protein